MLPGNRSRHWLPYVASLLLVLSLVLLFYEAKYHKTSLPAEAPLHNPVR
ncbi:MAG TPA: hypothetical protein VFA89_04425 [Terriglobales bacterium]|nr:hypothetical protein [Terriglobales bacterium]